MLALAVPILGVSALEVVRSAVELKVLGTLGSVELDAVITVNQTFRQAFMTFVVAVAWGSSALVAQQMGAREVAAAGRAMGRTMGLVLLIAVAAAGLANVGAEPVLAAIGLEGEVAAQAGPYLRWLGGVLPVSFLFFVLMSTLQAAGDVITPFLMVVVNTGLQLVLLNVLPLGAGPIPRLGVVGIAATGGLSTGAALALGLVRTRRLHGDLELRARTLRVGDWSLVRRIAGLSWPVLVQMSCRAVIIILMMRFLGAHGPASRAGYGVALRIEMMLLGIGMAFAGAAATVTGQNIGAHRPTRAATGGWIACGYYAAVLVCFTGLFWWKADLVIGAFSKQVEVIRVGATYLRISSATYPFLAAGFVFTRAMQGAGDMRRPMWGTLFSTFGVFLPLALWLSRQGALGATGLFLAAAAGMVAGGTLQTVLFLRGAWRYARA